MNPNDSSQKEQDDLMLGHPRKISPDTERQYHKFIKVMRRAFLDQNPNPNQDHDVTPTELVDFLYTSAHKYRPKTFINYRSALVYWVNTQAASPDVLHAKLMLQEGMPRSGFKSHREGAPPASLYSSRSQRKRTFKKRDLDKLLAELSARTQAAQKDNRRSDRANELLLWVRAGLASGLRPSEWETARWHDESKGELLVDVAKTKWDTPALPTLAGTPPAKPRTRIVTIYESDRLWVDQHLHFVSRHLNTGEPFSKYYNNNRNYLRLVCHDIFPNRPIPFTLYALRGQFAANRKKVNSLEAVAEEMGCAPPKAGTYYGKASHAHSSSGGQRHKEQEAARDQIKPSGPAPAAVTPRFSRPPKS